jgi:hypothetical protein
MLLFIETFILLSGRIQEKSAALGGESARTQHARAQALKKMCYFKVLVHWVFVCICAQADPCNYYSCAAAGINLCAAGAGG